MESKSNLETIQQELKVLRSQLFKIDLDDESSKYELKEILDKYLPNNFEPFGEEYMITRFDIEIVRLIGELFIHLFSIVNMLYLTFFS